MHQLSLCLTWCVCGCETSKLPCDVMLFTTVVSTLLRTLRPEVEQVTNSMKRPATKGSTKVNKGSILKEDATRYPQFGRFVQGQCSRWKPLGFPQVARAKLQLEVVTCHALLVVGTRLQHLTYLQDPTRYNTATTTVTAQRMLKHSQNVTAVQQHNTQQAL